MNNISVKVPAWLSNNAFVSIPEVTLSCT